MYTHESERRRTLQFKAKDSEVSKDAGVKPRSLCNARKKLQEYGIIRFAAGVGNVYVYTICDPETGCPYPGDSATPKPYVKKDNGQAPAPRAVPGLIRAQVPKPDLPPEAYGLPNIFGHK